MSDGAGDEGLPTSVKVLIALAVLVVVVVLVIDLVELANVV